MSISDLMRRSMKTRGERATGYIPFARQTARIPTRSRTFDILPPTGRRASMMRTSMVRTTPGITRTTPLGLGGRAITPSLAPARSIIPSALATPGIRAPRLATAAAPGGGLPALATGPSDFGLGNIGASLSSWWGDITTQAKNLIPIVIKIIAAVVIVKIVLWLIRGRRR